MQIMIHDERGRNSEMGKIKTGGVCAGGIEKRVERHFIMFLHFKPGPS